MSRLNYLIKTRTNLFRNFIPDKIKSLADNHPPWMNNDTKNKVKK